MSPGLTLRLPLPSPNSVSAGDITNTNLEVHSFVGAGRAWPRWSAQAAAQGWHQGQMEAQEPGHGRASGAGRAGQKWAVGPRHRWEDSRGPR